MPRMNELKEIALETPWSTAAGIDSLTVHALTEAYETEVLSFLEMRPLHTVYMAGFIRDNGLVSPLNRGAFYACRDEEGSLVGVSLIGHIVQLEVRSSAALEAFAQLTQTCPFVHVVMGEKDRVERFWDYYAQEDEQNRQSLRFVCRELLMERSWPVEATEGVPGLRRATLRDLPLVMPVQAEMAFTECGINPFDKDPFGFHQRYVERVERGRTWVVVEDGRLLFKAEVMAETPKVVYLEGVYVGHDERSKGYGLRCMSELGRKLLGRARSICLLVNEQNLEAQAFYYKAGFKFRSYYDTIYLQQKNV
ncbi:MAG: GNAT family N-acetyltransferase [Acidobacteriota bacterium]|nr:GNAT family N-acetyltransferase [Acidobacteriota bacterium]